MCFVRLMRRLKTSAHVGQTRSGFVLGWLLGRRLGPALAFGAGCGAGIAAGLGCSAGSCGAAWLCCRAAMTCWMAATMSSALSVSIATCTMRTLVVMVMAGLFLVGVLQRVQGAAQVGVGGLHVIANLGVMGAWA